MNDILIFSIFGFLATLIAVMTPVIKLTSNISEIRAILERFEKEFHDKHDVLSQRVDKHGEEIDDLQVKVNTHEIKIKTLEQQDE